MVKGLMNLGLTLMIALFCSVSFAQSFEGYIEFDWTKHGATTTYKYYVKGDNVRAVEINPEGGIEGVMLVNTKSGDQIALDPAKKLYTRVKNQATAVIPADVEKTSESKQLHGYKCQNYVATHNELNVTCEYYIADGNFDFFIPMINTLKRKENLVLFYSSIPNIKGGFPMIGEERTSSGELVMRLEVTKVTEATIDAAMFSTPRDYEEFKR